MKGLLAINAYDRSADYLYQPFRLKEEFAKKGVDVDVRRNDEFSAYIKDGDIVSRLTEYDFCIYFDKDKYISSMLSALGVPTFDSCEGIAVCDDKMTTYLSLAGKGIPMPNTLAGLLCYNKDEKVKEETLDRIENILGYPLVAKTSFGSLGQGIYLVKNREELRLIAEKLKTVPHLFQEFIESSYGKDLRVIVIGDEVVGGMLRSSDIDFRSNVGSGGKGEKYVPDEEAMALSLKIAKILRLDYCGIDLLFGKDGPVVCEVNSNAYFKTFEAVVGVNVAEKYVDRVLSVLNSK